MLQLVIKKRAENAIYRVAQYIASQYFPATGEKFINEVFDFCEEHALQNFRYPICRNLVLAKHGYSCIVFKKKWVVVFKCNRKKLIVYRFIYGPKLK